MKLISNLIIFIVVIGLVLSTKDVKVEYKDVKKTETNENVKETKDVKVEKEDLKGEAFLLGR